MIGRIEELKSFDHDLQGEESQFVAVYGRRRIGKTYLVREKFYDQFAFYHTGVRNGSMREQLAAFRMSLKNAGFKQCPRLTSWLDAFSCLYDHVRSLPSGRKVIFIDELPWMDTPRSNLVSSLEYHWNNQLSLRKDVFLIVCGSASSWIIENIVHNLGGLYNRLTDRIWLRPFRLAECEQYAHSRGLGLSRQEICEAYMIFGGVPYYWSLLRSELGFRQNIDVLCFSEHGKLRDEFQYLYASLFRDADKHLKVVDVLSAKKCGIKREEIYAASGLASRSTLKKVLDELVRCDFVRQYSARGKKNRDAFFQLIDNFTIFHNSFLKDGPVADPHFWTSRSESSRINVWNGLSFERVCLLHLDEIRRALGISGQVTTAYSWRSASDKDGTRGAQIDLVIERADKVINLCEMKYCDTEYELDKDEAERLRGRRAAFKKETGTHSACRITLVTPYGLKRNLHSGIVDNVITLDDLFGVPAGASSARGW